MVLQETGAQKNTPLSPAVRSSLEQSFDLFMKYSRPSAIFKTVSKNEFDNIFKGEGLNEEDTPISDIYKKATYLALYAVTLGAEISDQISNLTEENDYAGSYFLNTIASIAADTASQNMNEIVKESVNLPEKDTLLGYSPGYCGWHLSGQKRLFDVLDPGQIGITLNGSFHMSPIKSVTGALIGGPGEIHVFSPDYLFCKLCRTMSCTGRFKKAREHLKSTSL